MWIQGRTQMIRDAKNYEEAICRLCRCGFDGIEINAYGPDFSFSPEFFADGFGDRIQALLKERNVRSWTVGAHMDYTESEEKLEKALQAVRITRELGTDIMIITGAFRREEESPEDQWNRQISCMKRLGEEAEKYKVRLAVEYEPGFVIHNAELLCRAMAEAASPAFFVNADIGHFFLEEEEPLKALEKVADRIIHVHAENMKAGVHNHLIPWEGDMDLPSYFAKLREIGFDGPVSLDVYQYDYEEIAPRSIQMIRSMWET